LVGTVLPPEYFSSANSQADGGNQTQPSDNRWWWIGRVVYAEDTAAQWIMMLATIAAAYLLLRTLWATQDMARETTRIGEAQVRAYLVFIGVRAALERDAAGNVTGIAFKGVMRNTGQSPAEAVDLRTVVRSAPPTPKAIKFTFDNTMDFATRMEIGSGGEANTNSPFMPASAFRTIVAQGDWLYLYAETAYRDVFHRPQHGGPLNRATFAARVVPSLDMLNREEKEFGVPFTYCRLEQFEISGRHEG